MTARTRVAAGSTTAFGADHAFWPGAKSDTAQGGSEGAPKPEQGNQHTGPGDNNRGDIWIDAPGAVGEPGHEHDPQLGCGPFQVYGANLADASGAFAIYAWPPTGHKSLAYDGQWSSSGTAVQVISAGQPITLPDGHYKVTVVQDPTKHKTFWVHCGSGSTNGGTDSDDDHNGSQGDHDKQTDSGHQGEPHKHVDYGYQGGSVSTLPGAGPAAATARTLTAASQNGAPQYIAGAFGAALANTGSELVGLLLAGLLLATLGLVLLRRARRAS